MSKAALKKSKVRSESRRIWPRRSAFSHLTKPGSSTVRRWSSMGAGSTFCRRRSGGLNLCESWKREAPNNKELQMAGLLWTIIVILFVLWLVGFLLHVGGG